MFGEGGTGHTWLGNKVNLKEGEIFGKTGNTGGISLADNFAGLQARTKYLRKTLVFM